MNVYYIEPSTKEKATERQLLQMLENRSLVQRLPKRCVHCGEVNDHHRSLCPKKFKNTTSSAHLTKEVSAFSEDNVCAEENVLVSSDKTENQT